MWIWTNVDSFRILMMIGLSNCHMDHDGSHILLDQVILICIYALLWQQKENAQLHIQHFPACRCNDCTHPIGLQILERFPDHSWRWNNNSARGSGNWTNPIAFAQRWRCFKLGFIIWLCLTWWGGSGRAACSELYWWPANNRRWKQQQYPASLCDLLRRL